MNRRLRTLIVDDEALARRGLELRLADATDFEVVAQATNGREAIALCAREQPDVMFLDIQMPGLDGFDVLRQVPPSSLPIVVFVTAFDRFALDAFKAHALDYLLKPVDEQRFAQALDRVREAFRTRESARQGERLTAMLASVSGSPELDLEALLALSREAGRDRFLEVLPIRQGRETLRLKTSSIEWIDAAGDYMCVHAEGRTYVMRGTMKEFETSLDPKTFQRVHRSAIVNVQRVRSLRPHINGEYFLTLDGGHELKLSRTYREKLDQLLGARA